MSVDEKPFAITLEVGSSKANHTGSWRTERPVYVRRQAPCCGACPAAEDPQQWLYHAEDGDYETAWREIMRRNPFPAICGRVCYHPCETACNRAQLDKAVGINSVERFLGDQALVEGWQVKPIAEATGKRVLIIGAGPCGLSAAYHLALLGHSVTIKDAAPAAGGMMRYGIPKYRLPRDVLDAEVARIVELGVELDLGHDVKDLLAEQTEGKFDAVLIAVGAQLGSRTYVPAGSAAKILDAVSMLHSVETGEQPLLGRRVAVYGGGNTAMDAARTAKRLGAEDAVIVYRRTRDRMPAHETELEDALAEGVQVRWLTTVKRADAGKLTIEKMELDESGFPQPTGEFEELDADALVLATGQQTDLALLDGVDGIEQEHGSVIVDDNMMTGHTGIFAGGDMVPGDRTVTIAIGHGRRAALAVDRWLAPEGVDERHAIQERPLAADANPRIPAVTSGEEATFDRLNTWYYADAPRTVRPELDAVRRSSTFDEIVLGLDLENALFEARRCMSCGSCLACDNCYGVCPDNAVVKLDPAGEYAYEFDYDFCKGCGLCVAECPAGAIEMQPELI
jgi:NADPH-dependent glutamate synthase beta subunit-like oxidoreductase